MEIIKLKITTEKMRFEGEIPLKSGGLEPEQFTTAVVESVKQIINSIAENGKDKE